jgi:uncharacterized protein (DUF1330 family)
VNNVTVLLKKIEQYRAAGISSRNNFDHEGRTRMPAYVVVDLDVMDAEKFESYKQLVPATIEKYGGRYLARGGKVETFEGTWAPKRFVLLEFPSVDRARAWFESAEYAMPKALRQSCTRSSIIVVEGV